MFHFFLFSGKQKNILSMIVILSRDIINLSFVQSGWICIYLPFNVKNLISRTKNFLENHNFSSDLIKSFFSFIQYIRPLVINTILIRNSSISSRKLQIHLCLVIICHWYILAESLSAVNVNVILIPHYKISTS